MLTHLGDMLLNTERGKLVDCVNEGCTGGNSNCHAAGGRRRPPECREFSSLLQIEITSALRVKRAVELVNEQQRIRINLVRGLESDVNV